MPTTWFQFSNPYTGTPAGTGAGTSRSAASGDWALLLNRMDDSANLANIIMINEDAYLDHDGGALDGNSACRRFWGGRPGTGTHFRTWSTGRYAARNHSHVTFDSLNYTAQDAFTGSPTWQYVGSNVWSLVVGTFAVSGTIRSVWAANGEVRGQYTPGSTARYELCHRASSATCVDTGDWFSSASSATSQTLFVNSGHPTNNPDVVFGGLCFQWRDLQRSYCLQYLSQQRLTMDNWMCLGGGIVFSSGSGITCEDLIFNNLREEMQSNIPGLQIQLDDVPEGFTSPMRRLVFNEPVIRRNQEGSLSYRKNSESLVGLDHVWIAGYVSDVRFRNPVVDSRSAHTGIAVYAMTGLDGFNQLTATRDWPRNIEVYGTSPGGAQFLGPRGSNASKCYGRPFQANTDGQVTFRNFTCTGWNTAIQVAGRVKLENGYVEAALTDYDGFDNAGNDNKVGGLVFVGKSALGSDASVESIELNNVVMKTSLVSRSCVALSQNITAVNDYTKARFNHCTFIDTYPGATRKYSQDDGVAVYGPTAAIRALRWNSTGVAATFPEIKDCAFVNNLGYALGEGVWDVPTLGQYGFTGRDAAGLVALNSSSTRNAVFPTETAAGITGLTSVSGNSPLVGRTTAGKGTQDLNGIVRGAPNTLGAVEAFS